ncbi:MAG: copper-translocating P-type ATPase [Candidatus Omnitrophica bacterium CG11_big_fil_rev_8_21_14_0_20_45_26]|uniref:Copper-translocating P-type ATPase n=1 Tax=Candidatus Abzuiibacterium crystallinum TaxID=1974748 RepID=A0A2H0LRL9_9BACT|nr:MAG: copper-translocating P-type ATPase [Candidatus Omnitrophica bacterium CG11_big_fil_rev_8_21_14_0_20_45_26]PIW65318.1 MAG: copper-translocating P-type ATPase [Candidatus Omnitrophica bacterium CG12_big_fil_rev_8_21_14_0_65_45_16]
MKEHEHATKNKSENKSETKPEKDEVAKKAYAIYLKEGRPQGHAEQNWLQAEGKTPHAKPNHIDHQDHHVHMAADFRKRFWISLVLTLPILALSPMLQKLVGLREAIHFPGDIYVLFGFSSAVFWYGGWPFLKGLFKELKSRQIGMMTLISVAIATAYLYSSAVVFGLSGKMFFWELATLVDIMLLGHWIEMKSVMGASKALEELAKLMPSDAHKLMPDGSVKDVPLGELAVNDKVLIKPGEKIPADGVIVAGESSVNEAMLTGESTPVTKKTSAKVIGGAINGEGSLTIEVKGTGKDSFLSQVIDLVKQAQESKSKTQDLANTAALWLTIIALGGGVTTLLLWLVVMGKDFAFAIERAVTVMVIACPHALGLAVPLVVAVTTALAAKNGLLIRNRAAFEGARKLKAIIFDKTGTLTEGRFGITDTLIFSQDIDEETLRAYAASVDANSEHPIAKAITGASDKKLPVENFQSIPGKGAEGRVEGKEIKVVSPGFLREQNIDLTDKRIEPLQAQGKTVVFVLVDGKLKGAMALADIIRPEAKRAIDALKALNIRCMMLTGDNKATAKWVSDQIGLDEYFAEVLPQDKAAKVKEVQARGVLVAMTGDGVNDAPALAQADLGIAIGAGSDVAVETADVILVRSNPMDVVAILKLSRATYRKMIQNLIWATGYNTFAIPLAAGALYAWGVLLTPALGAVLMSVSTVIVAVNARLLRLKAEPKAEYKHQKGDNSKRRKDSS